MNEVEKMYRNAHVYPKVYRDITKETFEDKKFNMVDMCKEAFTAEKQIEICKFLLKVEHSISYYFYENRYGFVIDDKQDDCIEAEKFETALAMIVNDLWQDLTEEERKQIKGILE